MKRKSIQNRITEGLEKNCLKESIKLWELYLKLSNPKKNKEIEKRASHITSYEGPFIENKDLIKSITFCTDIIKNLRFITKRNEQFPSKKEVKELLKKLKSIKNS